MKQSKKKPNQCGTDYWNNTEKGTGPDILIALWVIIEVDVNNLNLYVIKIYYNKINVNYAGIIIIL